MSAVSGTMEPYILSSEVVHLRRSLRITNYKQQLFTLAPALTNLQPPGARREPAVRWPWSHAQAVQAYTNARSTNEVLLLYEFIHNTSRMNKLSHRALRSLGFTTMVGRWSASSI